MDFKNPILEKIFKRFKWSRNNTILLFKAAQTRKILNHLPQVKDKHTPQPIIFHFQCITTTVDSYYRILAGNKNQQLGILVTRKEAIKRKAEISIEDIENMLPQQLKDLQEVLKEFDDKQIEDNMQKILAIEDHEYIHQGQLIVLFREAGVKLPERFQKAWNL